MTRPAPAWRVLLACVALLLSACATPRRADVGLLPPGDVLRTGRLALSVQDQPDQSFSAGFELRGRPETGELTLLNPLGGTVARLRWQPGDATLQSQGRQPEHYPSLEAVVERATGAAVPVAALFDWLAGVPTAVPGWVPDLSGLVDGRVRAHRVQPAPEADLRVVLDR
ncbi:MAG: lipoprotein insertase outer membrane protein LolB [Ramlibacter sp.]